MVGSHIPDDAQRKWEWRKKRIPLPKFKRTKIVEKVKIKKLPGNKLTKQEAQNIDRFNKLSLQVLPEKVKVRKNPGLSIKEKRELESEIEDISADEEEEAQRNEKIRILKKHGVSLREKGKLKTKQTEPFSEEGKESQEKVRILKKPGVSVKEKKQFEPDKEYFSADNEEDPSRYEKQRVLKKPGLTLREKEKLKPKQTEFYSDDEHGSRVNEKESVRVVKKRGLSIKEKNKLGVEKPGCLTDDEQEIPNGRRSTLSDSVVIGNTGNKKRRKSRKDRYIETQILEEEGIRREMSQRTLNNHSGREYGHDDGYDTTRENQESQNDTYLPPIDAKYGASPQNSPTSSRKMTVHERLYDPDYRKNRSIPTEPEPIYVREFKSRPPKQLEHVKSRHMDASYFEPRGEYVLETDEDPVQQFKSNPPKNLEHVQSRHLSPEYQKKKQAQEGGNEEILHNKFVSRPPRELEHVQSKILDPKYFQEKPPQQEEEMYDTEFKARLPKKLEHVQSKIMDPKYLQEKQPVEGEKYDHEFKAKLPKKLEHVQSRILDPKKQRPASEEDNVSLPSFRAKPPKHLEQVGSRILDPAFYEPRPEYVYETEEDNLDHNFKARLPRSLQHVESRALDPKYFKKKIPPIPTEQQEAMTINHNFKARLPKSLAHVQSKAFDHLKSLSPRHETPVVELKQKGQVVVINVKKDHRERSKSEGYKDRFEAAREKDGYYHWKNDLNDAERKAGKHDMREEEKLPEKKERKPWRPPRKPKPEKIDKDYFDSWVMTPTNIYNDSNDMFYRNRKNVSEMWTSLAKSIKRSVIENGDRIRPVERTYY